MKCCSTTSRAMLEPNAIRIWTNAAVPPNDGGISLGQAALAAFHTRSCAPCMSSPSLSAFWK